MGVPDSCETSPKQSSMQAPTGVGPLYGPWAVVRVAKLNLLLLSFYSLAIFQRVKALI